MGDARDAAAIRRLRQGGGTQLGLGDGAGCWVSSTGTTTTTSTGSSSLFSSTSSSLTDDDDDATSCSLPGRRPVSSSSSPSSTSSLTMTSSDKMMQTTMDGTAGAGPLYELSTMLGHLPSLRTGLSKYYRGRSQSFTTPLADVCCVEDLAKKKAAPPRCIRRTKAPSRRYAAAALGAKNQLSKKIAKTKVPAADSLLLLSRASRNASLLRSSSDRPPDEAYHGKREVYRC